MRRALGATTSDVLRLVIANAARVIATGALIGLGLSAACGRLIERMLFGVRPLDLATFAFVTIVLGITAALSIAGPAWRAARIDPAVALRNTSGAVSSLCRTFHRFFLLKVCLYIATPRQMVSATAAAITRLSSRVFIASAFCHAEAAAPTD